MLLLIASRRDASSVELARRWRDHDAHVLTPRDLSLPGWQHRPLAPEHDVLVVDGQRVPAARITGVLMRLPYVPEDDLTHIVPEDRAYIANEMRAFLLSWLSVLPAPVLNRPTPAGLAGPMWFPEQWTRLAAASGLPVHPTQRTVGRDLARAVNEVATITVIVVGQHAFGTANTSARSSAIRLAKAADVRLLEVRFMKEARGIAFLDAHPLPQLESPKVQEAVLQLLHGGAS